MLFKIRRIHLFQTSAILVCCLLLQQPASASPFGHGLFGEDVPFGSATSLTIGLGSPVNLTLVPSGPNFTGSGSHNITVTSTDVVGYKLYAYSPSSTNMVNGATVIPTSGNVSPSTLSINTWGYNTDGSSNYVGMHSTPREIKDANGPFKNGDVTTVKYGVLTDITKDAGDYTVSVVYTAVAENQ